MNDLLECRECKKDFPEHLIQPLHVSNHPDIEDGHYLMCPLCALKIRNDIHGLPKDTPFTGTIAHQHWEEATKYARENH